jgi:hypothetical protein
MRRVVETNERERAMALCKCIIGKRAVSTVCMNRRGMLACQRVNTLTGSRWPGNAAVGARPPQAATSRRSSRIAGTWSISPMPWAPPSLYSLCSGPGHLQDGRQAPRNRVGAVTHVDLETSWRAPWTGVFTPGARNALDRDPPLARSYSTFASFSPITTSPAASTTQPPAEVLNWSHRSNGNST